MLDRIGDDARPALSAMKGAKPKTKSHVGDYVARMAQYVPEKFAAPAPSARTRTAK